MAIGRAISARARSRPGTDRRRRFGDASIRARTGAGAAIIRPVPLRSAYSPFRCVRGRNDATLSFLPRHAKFFGRSEEHTSELQSLMRISYAVFCGNKDKYNFTPTTCRTLA